jgi:tRNA (adenine57-N1/adenine58-N1)-methyltransferase
MADLIQLGSTVVVYNGNARELVPLVLRRGGDIQNQMGFFRHEDIVGKPFGSKVRSRV